jgi:hypothetical protein
MTTATPTVTGNWAPADALTPAATWEGQHDGAVQLTDGMVLVAGGADAGSAPQSRAALLDPANGHWAPTGSLHTPRRLHTLTLLADGRVLAAGGTGAGPQFPTPALAGAEIYDPAAKVWSTSTPPMHTARWGHSATLLQNGKVLVTGGTAVRSTQSNGALRSAELFDPAAGPNGTWTEVAAMTDARTGHVAVRLGNGNVLVIGGSVPTGRADEAALAFCELFDGDDWTPTGSLTVPRSRHAAVLLSPTSVLVTGGSPPGPADDASFDPFSRATAERYDATAGQWTAAKPMPAGRQRHRAVALGNGRALIVGGADDIRDGAGFAATLLYDGDWTTLGGLATGRWGLSATALADGRVFATGGVTRTGQATATGTGAELTATTELFTLTVVQ